MKKVFLIWSPLNEMGFGVEVEEEDLRKAIELAEEGFARWNDPEEYPEYEGDGYAEPSMELMDEAGIKYRILDEEEMTDPDDDTKFNIEFIYRSDWGWADKKSETYYCGLL